MMYFWYNKHTLHIDDWLCAKYMTVVQIVRYTLTSFLQSIHQDPDTSLLQSLLKNKKRQQRLSCTFHLLQK